MDTEPARLVSAVAALVMVIAGIALTRIPGLSDTERHALVLALGPVVALVAGQLIRGRVWSPASRDASVGAAVVAALDGTSPAVPAVDDDLADA